MARSEGGSGFWTFLFGAVCGTVGGLLIAPTPGEETRRRLRYLAEELSEKAGEESKRLRAFADDVFPTVREAVSEQKERITAAVEAGRRAFREEQDL